MSSNLPRLNVDFNALGNVGSIRVPAAQVAALVPPPQPLQRCLAVDDDGNTCEGFLLPSPLHPDGYLGPHGPLLLLDWMTWQDGPNALEE